MQTFKGTIYGTQRGHRSRNLPGRRWPFFGSHQNLAGCRALSHQQICAVVRDSLFVLICLAKEKQEVAEEIKKFAMNAVSFVNGILE